MIDCDKITKPTKDLMFKLMKASSSDSRERYMKLCEDKNIDINSGGVCIGEECTIYAREIEKIKCPNNTREIGNFHTHTSGNEPSQSDIIATAEVLQESFCVGYSHKDMISCYNIKNEDILKLGRDVQDLLQQDKVEEAEDITTIMENKLFRRMRDSEPHWGDILDVNCTITMNTTTKDRICSGFKSRKKIS